VWSRNADTSPSKEERCDREWYCDNSNLKYHCIYQLDGYRVEFQNWSKLVWEESIRR
jgi:hypothetical protein